MDWHVRVHMREHDMGCLLQIPYVCLAALYIYKHHAILRHIIMDSECTMVVNHTNRFQCINTLNPRQNGCHFADKIFKLIFLHENSCIYIHWNWFSRVHLKLGSIGSNDVLVWNRRQAIIWTNDGLIYWCIYASLSLHGLTYQTLSSNISV